MQESLVVLDRVKKQYGLKDKFLKKGKFVRAVDGISLAVNQGETLGVVGESGCGKSTLSRLILGIEAPTEGIVSFDGKDIQSCGKKELKHIRRSMQAIFQDPYSSLNPRKKVESILAEPFIIHQICDKKSRFQEILHLLETVGLGAEHAARYPHELSGGQRQRVGIARALTLKPKFIVADEPVSALDVSIQAQIINLLVTLKEKFSLTYLFIAHDLAVVQNISDRIVVMYLGRLMEVVSKDHFLDPPQHPYTKALLEAIPIQDPLERKARSLSYGDSSHYDDTRVGCVFCPRCEYAKPLCRTTPPALKIAGKNRWIACHLF
ncbi:MAG: oligopeptide/dipeptide ABC transporter ATP-binding protein [Pseudomonadota bacterium]